MQIGKSPIHSGVQGNFFHQVQSCVPHTLILNSRLMKARVVMDEEDNVVKNDCIFKSYHLRLVRS